MFQRQMRLTMTRIASGCLTMSSASSMRPLPLRERLRLAFGKIVGSARRVLAKRVGIAAQEDFQIRRLLVILRARRRSDTPAAWLS